MVKVGGRKLRAIGVTSGIGSMLIGARTASFEIVGNIEWRKYYHTGTFEHNFPGAFMVHSFDEIEGSIGKIDLAIGHPECLTNGSTRIFTSKGWIPIKKIRLGDSVLTHRGRFKKVIRIFRRKAEGETKKVKICLATPKTGTRSLVVTGNHPLLMEDGTWKQAKGIVPGDRVVLMIVRCKICGGPIPDHPGTERTFCSSHCQVIDQWNRLSDKGRKAQVSKANEITKDRVSKGEHQFQDPVVRRRGQVTIGRRSKHEMKVAQILSGLGVATEHQHPVGDYFIDLGVIESRVAIEVDGGKWHNAPRKKTADRVKTAFLEDQGWTVIRIRSDRIDQGIKEVIRILKNHSGKYEFSPFEVKCVIHSVTDRKITLYNLGVEEDSSFIAKGFVVHNCGNFSNLRTTSKVAPDDPGDIPVFTDLIQRIKPRYFVMDNLPGSLIAYPMSKWHSELPEYELYPEWVSNYHYGNVQKNRRRFFLVGALRGEKYVFVPGEFDHSKTLRDVIKDLPDYDLPDINHVHAPDDRIIPCGWAAHQLGIDREGNKVTLGELKDYIRDYPIGKNFEYLNLKGELKLRPGYCKIKLDHFAPVMTGGGSALDNHYREDTLNPLTIRERARIQGCPDDFIFQPIGYFDERNLRQAYMAVYKQSGKFMPVEFCEYVCRQIAAHVNRRTWEATGKRIANPNPHVDEAKQWYCENVGYENQDQACGACWLSTRCRVKGGTMVQVKTKEPVRRRQVPKEKVATAPVKMREGIGLSIKKMRRKGVPPVVDVQRVRCARGSVPPDYHCRCRYCEQVIGELRPADGSYYSRLERNQYYDPTERGKGQGHIAKTPLHIARWAVQRYSEEGDWVLDPTAGAGTTLVEALVQGRNAAGIELQYTEILEANVSKHTVGSRKAVLGFGDARNVGMMAEFLTENDSRPTLVVNNPPYFGDQSFPGPAKEGVGPEFRDKETTYFYDKTLPNLAFLKEGDEYWSTMTEIYRACVDVLLKGGHFVVGVKDQMRRKKPDGLHMKLADVLSSLGMKYVGTSFLKHHPPTLFLNTYEKIHGVPPVRYQTILVFKKG